MQLTVKHLHLVLLAAAAAIAPFLDSKEEAQPAKTDKKATGKKTEEKKPAAAGDGLDDDDLDGVSTSQSSGDGLDDDDLDGGDKKEEKKPAEPTEADARAALLKLKAHDGGKAERCKEIMAKAINDPSKQPTITNVPANKYAAVIKAVEKRING